MSDSALANAQATQAAIDAAIAHAPETPAPAPSPVAATEVLDEPVLIGEPINEPDPILHLGDQVGDSPDADTQTLPELAQQIVRRPPLLDPGWLWLIAGLALVCTTLILPAQRDLEEARFFRDRVLTAEDHRQQRLARYQDYLDALERGDETLVLSLAAMQLNKAPRGTDLLVQGNDISNRSASVFTNLEPAPLRLPQRPERELSTLEKWTSNDRSRLWLLGGGSVMILIGLLPAATRRA